MFPAAPLFGGMTAEGALRQMPASPNGAEAKTNAPAAACRDTQAPDEWIEGALAYVPCVARRFLGCGLSFDDLLAAGNLGLVQAALRFDPARNVKFVTYADWWIRKAILKTIQEHTGPVRLPRYRLEQLRELHEARTRLQHDSGREPTAEELARATHRSSEEIDVLLGIGRRGVSLESPGHPDELRPLNRTLADDLDKSPQRTLLRKDSLRHMRRSIEALDTRERIVLELRFGLSSDPALTLREAGRRLGISRERVRQIERRALDHLRALL